MTGFTDAKLLAIMLQDEVRGEALARLARWCDLDQHVAPVTSAAKALVARRIADRLGLPLDVPVDGRVHCELRRVA